MDKLTEMLQAQRDLQINSFGMDPSELTGEARIEFIRWNVLALEDELHEMLGEVGWKPWATSKHVNAEPALKEMVDAWHFFMNILWAVFGDATEIAVYGSDLLREPSEALANTFRDRYMEKKKRNAERQAEGYDGLKGKCPGCKRDLREVEIVLSESNLTHCGGCGTRVNV